MMSSREIKQVISQSEEPKFTTEATERIVKILSSSANHKADLGKVVTKATQLTNSSDLVNKGFYRSMKSCLMEHWKSGILIQSM
jgi:hypothetical protein